MQLKYVNHPEAGPDEVHFIDIEKYSEWASLMWESKRQGCNSYDKDGKIVKKTPIFVKRSELFNAGLILVCVGSVP